MWFLIVGDKTSLFTANPLLIPLGGAYLFQAHLREGGLFEGGGGAFKFRNDDDISYRRRTTIPDKTT